MIKTSYHDSVNVLQGLSLSDALACGLSPFDRPEWFALLQAAGLEPLVAICEDHEGAIALVLQNDRGALKSMRNWYSFTWRPLGESGARNAAKLIPLAKDLKSRSHRAIFEAVPDEDGVAEWLASSFRDAGWKVAVSQCDTNHILPVAGRSFAQYWAQRPGRLRTTLKRKAKKVSVDLLDHFDQMAWRDYETIYSSSWKPAEDYPDMLRDFARQEGEAGRLRLAVARHQHQAVAAQLWTVENGTAYIHKLAHLESHKNLSAGTTLTATLFERVIDVDKVELIDFGTGDEPYKADWMEQTRRRMRVDCFNTASLKGAAQWAKFRLSQLRA